MKTFLHCNSVEPGIKRVRIDIDTISAYFEYDGTQFEPEEDDDIFPPEIECVIIKTDAGNSYFVSETLEDIDNIFEEHDQRSRFGFIGGGDHD